MKKKVLFLVLALSLFFAPIALAQDEEPTPAVTVEGEGDTDSVGEGETVVLDFGEEAPDSLEGSGFDFILDLLAMLPDMVGVAGYGAIVAAAINLVKLFADKFPDGASLKVATFTNALIFGALWVGQRYGMRVNILKIIEQVGVALPAIVTLLSMMVGSKFGHKFMLWINPEFSLTNRKISMVVAGRGPSG